jgi:hypothetical protein
MSTVLRVGAVTLETDGEVVLPTEEGGSIVVKPNVVSEVPKASSQKNNNVDDVFSYARVVNKPHEFIVDVDEGGNDVLLFDGDCGTFYGASEGDLYAGGNVAYRIFPLDVDGPEQLGVDLTLISNASQNAVLYGLQVEMEDDTKTFVSKLSEYNLTSSYQMEYLTLPVQPWIGRVAVSQVQLQRKLKISFVMNNTVSRKLKVQMLPNMQLLPADETWARFF